MMNCIGDMAGMGWMMAGMGVAGVLILVVLVLAAAALVKFLRKPASQG